MNNKRESYLNVTLKKENDDEGEALVNLRDLFKNFKRYLAIWICASIIVSILSLVGAAIFKSDDHKELKSLVSFAYKGIESGLDPAGNKLDVNTLKSPAVIEMALTNLGRSVGELEAIRQDISIEGIIPKDAIERITAYKSIYESGAGNSSLDAAQQMLDTKYYPTQYNVSFNYANTGYKPSEAVQVFNEILNCYQDYFFDTYGYNKSLGSAITTLDYNDYDYSEAVDVFNDTLSTLKSYVDQLSVSDATRFRSNITGYTFADLSETISTIKSIDLDLISSYIAVNNVTKDKDAAVTYYQYRVEQLTRERAVTEEKLASIIDSFNNYKKDTVLLFGEDKDSLGANYTQASPQYDSLINQKIDTQTQLSSTTQRINYYNSRITALNSLPVGSQEKMDKVDGNLQKLNEKVNVLLDNVNKTADEYYENVSFSNAYNVLVPASSSNVNLITNALDSAKMILLIGNALIFVIYIFAAVISSIKDGSKKKTIEFEGSDSESDSNDDEKKEDIQKKVTKKQ